MNIRHNKNQLIYIYINRIIQEEEAEKMNEKRIIINDIFFLWTVIIEIENPTFLFYFSLSFLNKWMFK
jgi:hypothetical protein